ncbi:hypothetical protein AB6A40_000925 [Gnathostoma spinigerum]|uniref:F-box/LRR-repeat protein 15-like leucin rich repeat domain-containing protein n=1 Tax=Gnathostoma spinigerum TaxID=75299 RepID=A0ABD6E9Y3_9BILA
MVNSLFNICLSNVCQQRLDDRLAFLPIPCKQQLLEFFGSHDQLSAPDCIQLVSSRSFGINLTRLSFFLSDQLSDELLKAIAVANRSLEEIQLIECSNVTDQGIVSITQCQRLLRRIVLRGIRKLTSLGISHVRSKYLHTVDLSSCCQVTDDGIYRLVNLNPNITCLYLNRCAGLTDQALYDIADSLRGRLSILELDFLPKLVDPGTTLFNLSRKCPNIQQLSLCRFFEVESSIGDLPRYRIDGVGLRYVDLCGNYFFALPLLPPTVKQIRLSVFGDEDPYDLVFSLQALPQLTSIHLHISARDQSNRAVEDANRFLCTVLPTIGHQVTRLHVYLNRLVDTAFCLITQCLPKLSHLALDVKHINNNLLQRFFSIGSQAIGSKLKSLRLCRLRITYRALFAIARGARCITDLETSHMLSVDDRFLALLADNCRRLKNVNFNGCRYVTDKGLMALARNGLLKEVRIRATSCTDKSIYILAQFCPHLEWISHADFSGRPKFSNEALQCLRDSCIQRVIC